MFPVKRKEMLYTEDKTFDKADFTEMFLAKGEYENCRFVNCNFSNSDLSDIKFLDCEFTGCNLSLVKLVKTGFGEVKFKDCKMLGLRFDTCNKFGFSIQVDNCNLDNSSFYQAKLIKTVFKNAQLREMDFTESDLTGSVFDNCDLSGTLFENTDIEKADFRTSYNFSIDPNINRVKKAKFSLYGLPGLLNKYDIEIHSK